MWEPLAPTVLPTVTACTLRRANAFERRDPFFLAGTGGDGGDGAGGNGAGNHAARGMNMLMRSGGQATTESLMKKCDEIFALDNGYF